MEISALIIDDERDICELIEMGLMGQGVKSDSVYSVKSAIKQLKENHYDVIFCDVRLPDGDGLDLLTHINKHYPLVPVCVMTAHGSMDMAIRALKLGAFDFINKPFELKQLRTICKSALKESKSSDTGKPDAKIASKRVGNETVTRQVDLIGEASVMKNVRQMITRVAHSQAPVFIHGESGTGKEVAARAIHEQSSRQGGPFVAVNCGAIPENLVESEFFGYKKGAFTGANQDTDGLFVAANGGTLFLDEVADLPLQMQVKLLRAIQERAVRPIGGEHEEAVDARIISATHHDLAAKVQAGDFREDLFYRLNVIALELPPLREREGDVLVLADFLLNKLAEKGGYATAKLSHCAKTKLASYDFPGNVRELENVLERALTFMDGEVIDGDDIHINVALRKSVNQSVDARKISMEENRVVAMVKPAVVNNALPPLSGMDFEFGFDSAVNSVQDAIAASNYIPPQAPEETPDNLDQYMQDMEKQVLLKALEESGQNKTKAAEALGISFRAMRYKLKKLGID